MLGSPTVSTPRYNPLRRSVTLSLVITILRTTTRATVTVPLGRAITGKTIRRQSPPTAFLHKHSSSSSTIQFFDRRTAAAAAVVAGAGISPSTPASGSLHWTTTSTVAHSTNRPANNRASSERSCLMKMSSSSLASTSCMSFASYLHSLQPTPTNSQQQYNVILGNEAGDADSVISSLTLSYTKATLTEDDKSIMSMLPVVSIPRNDIALRRETVLLLQLCGIDIDKLLYLDDEPVQKLLLQAGTKEEGLEVTLIDHNKIKSKLSHLTDNVMEILDHHQDLNSHPTVMGTKRNIAFVGNKATVGSSCTLVTELWMDNYLLQNQNNDEKQKLDGGVALSLLGVILIDTMNMSVEADKGTKRDAKAIDFLLEYGDWENLQQHMPKKTEEEIINIIFSSGVGKPPNRIALYDYLRNAKMDIQFWESLSVRDCLRLDYKRFEPDPSSSGSKPFGLSSILLPVTSFLSKPNLEREVQEFITEMDVDWLGTLHMVVLEGVPQREVLLFGKADCVNPMVEFLLYSKEAKFLDMKEEEVMMNERKLMTTATTASNEEEEMDNDGMKKNELTMRRLRQGNVKGSRKQVAPIMMQFLEK